MGLESVLNWVDVKAHVMDDVLLLVAPVSDDALVDKLIANFSLPLLSVRDPVAKLVDLCEATLSGHELENGVHNQSAA